MPGIFAFVEARDGEIRPVSREVVTAARSVADGLGEEVHAVVLGGAGIGDQAGSLSRYGADRIFVGADEAFTNYSVDGYARALAAFIREHGCSVVIFPASSMGKDLAPRVAARLGVDYAAECTALEVEGGTLAAVRPQYAGKVFATVRFPESPAVLSVRPNVFQPVEAEREGALETFTPERAGDFGSIVRELKAGSQEARDVSEAPVVVSGGRGLRDPENFKILEDLAGAFGNAAVGASRAVVDAGWRPHGEQVGQTGKTVSPSLYFAIGISGAIQHLAGMRTAKCIVAINKDPDAPIFKIADYGIVGDLFEVVPRLTEEIRRLG